MTLSERNYPYTKQLLGGDKEAQDAWTVYRIARTGLGMNADRALDIAATAVRTPDNENDLAIRSQRAKDVAEKVTNQDWGSSLANYFPGVNDTAKNVSEVQKRVLDVASVLTRVQGLSLDEAAKYGMEAVAQRSMIINGHLVPETGEAPTQAQKPYIEKLLDTAFQMHGEKWGASSPKDLYVAPAGGGNFAIWMDDKLGGPPCVRGQERLGPRACPDPRTRQRRQQHLEADGECQHHGSGAGSVHSGSEPRQQAAHHQ
jgi:hypothetical protein